MKTRLNSLYIKFFASGKHWQENSKILKYLKIRLYLIIVLTIFSAGNKAGNQPGPGSLKSDTDIHQWIKEHFAKGKVPPFSFVYDGADSKTFITRWAYSAEKQICNDPDLEKYLFTYSDRNSGLIVKCFVTGFKDFPAVEWVLKFSNTSNRDTPILKKPYVLNYLSACESKGIFILHHAKGSSAAKSDFMPIDDTLKVGKSIEMMPVGGRSSDNTALPFYNVESPGDDGIMVAIGWSGKWCSEVLQTSENTLSLKAGMERMELTLYPGEEIRSPLICLLFWKGEDRMTGHNLFRQFILSHHTRQINGHFAELPLSSFLGRGGPAPCNEASCLTELYALATIERLKQFNILPEVVWLDAGWYTGSGKNWSNVGSWTVDKDRFPNGLKPITDAVHAAGAKFLLWFEPERVRAGTMLEKEHSEWLLKIPGNQYSLLDLGNKEARLWLTDYISSFLIKEGVDYYRQDFGLEPQEFWKANDKPDRIGISEIRHIEGLYALWDSLLVRFPNLIIDNCASGGRRIDLETVSRSSPLWRTDYSEIEPNGYQCHTYGINFYLPLSGTGNILSDKYGFRSSMSSAMVLSWDINSSHLYADRSFPEMQKYIQDFKRLRPYYYGDYYPLTSAKDITQDNVWLAYQLNRPGQENGLIMAFRRKDNTDKSIQVKLRGVDEEANYELNDEDSGTKITRTGKELMTGFTLTLDEKPGSLLIFYKKIN
jgi:alpha-galactosidase